MISIHAPQWGATRSASLPWQPIYFNPRTPVGCDVARTDVGFNANEFQSTHPSGVRRADGQGRGRPLQISIHAPQWGATGSGSCDCCCWLFQSTHPSGVRPTPAGCTVKHYQISIHAPQWGATGLLFAITCDTPYFNPRTPVGCDLVFGVPATASSLFQSTHPSGVRPPRICWTSSFSNFNPRTPVGCDGVS